MFTYTVDDNSIPICITIYTHAHVDCRLISHRRGVSLGPRAAGSIFRAAPNRNSNTSMIFQHQFRQQCARNCSHLAAIRFAARIHVCIYRLHIRTCMCSSFSPLTSAAGPPHNTFVSYFPTATARWKIQKQLAKSQANYYTLNVYT